ncbi:iron uptake porin [uncultured Nostoc sp.]|uniref:iron uptake porin n=1 Tax=uncultured Nostoc sp. TaxID=340711 RepID=UPI0035C97B73
MGHKFKNIAIIFQLTFGLLLYFSHPAFAQTSASVLPAKQDKPLVNDTAENTDQGQVTSVSQLSDVKPTDWAFQALQSLVERYGCIAGYSDSTYRGNRALSRYEFAAGVNACLSRVNELLASTTDSLVKKDDLALLQKLQESFAPELATLRGRVDALEVRAATVEKQQFSTTTKLYGNALFSLTAIGGNKQADGSGAPVSRNLIASDFLWLTFDTSFTGKDLLRTRLQASNTPNLSVATGTNMGRLTLDDYDSPNQLTLAKLSYQFKVGDKLSIHIGANDELHEMLDDDVDAVSPLGDHVNGSISLFGQFNPIFAIGGEDVAGGSLTYEFSKAVRLSAAYAAGGNSNNPNSGLFGGTYVGLAELTLRPIDHLTFALTYTHSYSADNDEPNNALNTGTGSINASDPFNGSPTSANSYGVNMAYDVSRQFTLAASAGFTYAHAEGGDNQGANADIVNWSVTAAFPNLGGEGNLGGFVIGLPPKVTSNDVATRVDPNSSLELELFYRYAINDAIAVTPGLIMVTNPEHNSNNDTIYIGTLRTTFSF